MSLTKHLDLMVSLTILVKYLEFKLLSQRLRLFEILIHTNASF